MSNGTVENKEFKISFLASGDVTQTLELVKEGVTPKDVIRGLKSGEYATTIQEGGTLEVVGTGEVIAKVVSVENNLSYDDYELEF